MMAAGVVLKSFKPLRLQLIEYKEERIGRFYRVYQAGKLVFDSKNKKEVVEVFDELVESKGGENGDEE